MAHRDKKRRGIKHPVLLLALLALLAAASVLTILTLRTGTYLFAQKPVYSPEEIAAAEGKIQVNGEWYRKKRYIQTCLILGIDKTEGLVTDGNVNNQQNDFNALMVVNLEDRTYTVVYLNRDTMTNVPQLAADGTVIGGKREQLSLAHTYGTGGEDNCRNAARAVSKLLYGAPVDHYAAFYLDAIGTINDAVGGVTVKIEDDFSGVDSSLVRGSTVKLNASQAETFVRGRWGVSDQTNLNRMSRQRTYLTAWKEQAFARAGGDGQFFGDLTTRLEDSFATDLSLQKISDMSRYLQEFEEQEPRQPEGRSVKGRQFMEFYVDEEALMDLVLELFFEHTQAS